MMQAESREEDPCINMVLRSGTTIGGHPQEEHKRYDTPTKAQNSKLEQRRTIPREAQRGSFYPR